MDPSQRRRRRIRELTILSRRFYPSRAHRSQRSALRLQKKYPYTPCCIKFSIHFSSRTHATYSKVLPASLAQCSRPKQNFARYHRLTILPTGPLNRSLLLEPIKFVFCETTSRPTFQPTVRAVESSSCATLSFFGLPSLRRENLRLWKTPPEQLYRIVIST